MKYSFTREQVENAVNGSSSIKEVLIRLNMKVNNGNYGQIKKIVSQYDIDLPKYDRSVQLSNLRNINKIPDEEFFVLGVMRNGQSLKRRLVNDQGFEDRCYADGCVVGSVWNGKPITIQVDHINGNRFDNRLENLQLLCPNCHSQTDTYGNNSKSLAENYKYCQCGVRVDKQSKMCKTCSIEQRMSVTDSRYPSVEDLSAMIRASSVLAVSKKLGVSDNAVRKYLKRRGVDTKTLR